MLKSDKYPNVRFYYTQKNAYMDDTFFVSEEKSGWKEFSEGGARAWSAVGYIFGKKLAKDLEVTVGILGCNWGGTSASCWMSEDSLSEDKELNTYLEEYYTAIKGKSEQEQIKEYKEYEMYAAQWDAKYSELYAKNPEITWDEVLEACGENRWPGPKSCINPYRPGGLYHCMLQRLIPYTLRGFIYYQGESDDHKPLMYQKLLTRLIRQWREDWEDQTLPFLMVQLPMHRYKADPDYKHWCLIREAQMNTFETIKNTGIAVALDCGEFNEIHPKDKTPVGERLELQAMYHVYKQVSEQEAFGPVYRSYEYKEAGIELCFDYTEQGFLIKGEPGGLEIAGEDKNFVKAEVEIRGSRIYIFSSEIVKPMYARYCWTNYGEVTIFGKNGIPLAPFRTHNM
jgi:sialate O-acetylesterase